MDFGIDFDKLARNPWAVGAAGSLIAAWKALPGAGVVTRLFNAAGGTFVAGVCAPLAADALTFKSPNALAVIALVLGLLGMSLCDQLLGWARHSAIGQRLDALLDRIGFRKAADKPQE